MFINKKCLNICREHAAYKFIDKTLPRRHTWNSRRELRSLGNEKQTSRPIFFQRVCFSRVASRDACRSDRRPWSKTLPADQSRAGIARRRLAVLSVPSPSREVVVPLFWSQWTSEPKISPSVSEAAASGIGWSPIRLSQHRSLTGRISHCTRLSSYREISRAHLK